MSAQKLLSILKIFIFAILLTASEQAFAQAELQCEPVPDCEELGYKQEVDCPNGAYVACPFNAAYKKCVNQSCADLGFSTTDKSRWCKVVVTCPTDLAYTLCAEPDPCASFNLTFDESLTYDSHCYECSVCNSGNGDRYKCVANLQPAYYIIDGVCTYDPCDGYDITNETYLSDFATEPEVHCQTCESCVSPEGPTVWKCNNLSPQEGYFVAENGVCTKDACFDYRLPENLAVGDAANCYDCTQCPTTDTSVAPLYAGYWKCEVNEKNDYHLVGNECVQDPCPGYNITQEQYRRKYGSSSGQHCYNCQKCNNEDSTHNGNYKCEVKDPMDEGYVLSEDGTCSNDPCAGYDMTFQETVDFLGVGNGSANTHCYECKACVNPRSPHYNSNQQLADWKCSPKETPDFGWELVGDVCQSDQCSDYTITPEEYESTYSQGYYSECFVFTECPYEHSVFSGYYKMTEKASPTFGYYISGGECLKDPCYDEYEISYWQLNNYNEHCYDCEKCPYSPSGKLTNYYKCVQNIDPGYELVGNTCRALPCADYTLSESGKSNAISNLGPYWYKCVEFDQCNEPNAPDELKDNYKMINITSSTGWKINSDGECVLCENGHLCIDKTPGETACADASIPATFYTECTVDEHCFNNKDVTADCGTLGTGTCTAPKNKPSYSYTYVKTNYSCQTIDLQTIPFYRPLTKDYCKPDCECNCNPIYQMKPCKTVDYTASYCYGLDSDDFPCNAITDAGCTAKKEGAYYYCDTCNETYQCEVMSGKYYDDDGSVIPSRSGCSLDLLPENHCAASANPDPNCTWNITGTSVSEKGIYFVAEVCSNSSSGKKIVYVTGCTKKDNDCEGGIPPAYNRKTNKAMVTCGSSQTGLTYAYDEEGELRYDEEGNLIKLYGDDANPVDCGGYLYYDGCRSNSTSPSCEETCSYKKDPPYTGYNKCDYWTVRKGITPTSTTHKGQEPYMKKCDQDCSDNSVWYFSKCAGELTDKDCSGNPPVAAGLMICPDGYEPTGRTVSCGGYLYSEGCRQKCNYDQKEEDCIAIGQCFEAKCRNEDNIPFGICVDC